MRCCRWPSGAIRLTGTVCVVLMVGTGCASVYTSKAPRDVAVETPSGRRVEEPASSVGAQSGIDRADPGRRTLPQVLASLVWPFPIRDAASLSSTYGIRVHPVRGRSRFHAGLDIHSSAGDPIHAVADGQVIAAGRSGAYGLRVMVDHQAGLVSLYAHASEILVDAGDRVRRGEPIALVGATGNATGPHLHFELRWGGGTVDPRTVLPRLAGSSRHYPGD